MSNLSIRDTISGSVSIGEGSTKGIIKGSVSIGEGSTKGIINGSMSIGKGDKGDKGDNNVCIGLSPTLEAEIWFDTADGDNTKEVATKEYIDSEIAKIDSSNFATKTELSNKVDKVNGKSLISDSEIERLSTLKNYDDSNIRSQLNDIENEIDELKDGNIDIDIDLTNYVTKSELSSKADKSELHSHDNKSVLDQISTYTLGQWNGHINNLDVHITASERTKWNNKSTFSGNYNDLTNKPTIPTKTSQLANDSSFITSIPSEYVTETELNNKGYLTQHQDISGKADKSTLAAHTSDTTSHITETERNTWNNMSNGKIVTEEKVKEIAGEVTEIKINEVIGELNTEIDNINSSLDKKQNKTDNALNTTSKEIIGAINEVNSKINKEKYLSATGYDILPSGLILQWGKSTLSTSSGGGRVEVTYPISFPNASLAQTAQVRNCANDYTATRMIALGRAWRSSMTILVQQVTGTIVADGSTCTIDWIALGH